MLIVKMSFFPLLFKKLTPCFSISMYSTKSFLLVLDISEPREVTRGRFTSFSFKTLNKAPLYSVCVPNEVKGESSDVNIQIVVCVTKELIR